MKAAGVLIVAQLKGFDPASKSWFCSSNTYRPNFLPEWSEKLKEARAALRAQAREERIASRAQAPRKKRTDEDSSRPHEPEFDPQELEDRRREALDPSEVKTRAELLRSALRRPKPPPSS